MKLKLAVPKEKNVSFSFLQVRHFGRTYPRSGFVSTSRVKILLIPLLEMSCRTLQKGDGKLFLRTNSMKPFHCSGSSCDGQTLFGTCAMSHPYAFDNGKKCCSRPFDAENEGKDSFI